MKITESKIIKSFLKPLTFNDKRSLKLEDDVYYDKKNKLVFSTDTYEENVHFLNSDSPCKFAKKIFRSAISDIFCKGARPIVYFLSISSNKTSSIWYKRLKDELKKDSKKYGLFLGGGDIIKSKNLTFTISVIGFVKKKPILRSNAKKNDDIYLTGNIGDAHLGLLASLKKYNFGNLNNYFKKIFQQPDLPSNFSLYLDRFSSSSIDISDGLINDLTKICSLSKRGATINLEQLPFSKKFELTIKKKNINKFSVFSKGDDYQIIFTSNRKYRNLIRAISKKTSTKITRIGVINDNKNVKFLLRGKLVNFSGFKTGYIHSF